LSARAGVFIDLPGFLSALDLADDFAIGMQSEPDDRLATPSSGFRVLICSRI